jgi:hypothetical protein
MAIFTSILRMRHKPSAKKESRKGPGIKVLTSISAITLLLLYVAGTVEIDSLHSYVHPEKADFRNPAAQEKDPCHLAIYHNVHDNGCHHKTHLVVSYKCPFCQISLHTEHVVGDRISYESVIFERRTNKSLTNLFILPPASERSSRAPPRS